jgi:vacuolar-type H+-ATPase subunit H
MRGVRRIALPAGAGDLLRALLIASRPDDGPQAQHVVHPQATSVLVACPHKELNVKSNRTRTLAAVSSFVFVLALTGCGAQNDVAESQSEVKQAEQESAQQMQEARVEAEQKIQEARQQGPEELKEARQEAHEDLQNAREEARETVQEARQDQREAQSERAQTGS